MKTKTKVSCGLDWQLPDGTSVPLAVYEKWLKNYLGIGAS